MVATNEDNESLNTIGFITKHFNIVLIAVAFFVNFGIYKANDIDVQNRVTALEAIKGEQIKWVVDQHEKRLGVLEEEQKSERDTVYEMKTKIDIIAQWVSDQKAQKDRGADTTK